MIERANKLQSLKDGQNVDHSLQTSGFNVNNARSSLGIMCLCYRLEKMNGEDTEVEKGGVVMVHGVLTISLDPPYCGFTTQEPGERDLGPRECTVDEIRALLLDMGLIPPEQSWPPKDYIAKMEADFSSVLLSRWGMLPVRLEPVSSRGEVVSTTH